MDTNESSSIVINFVTCNCNESGKLDFSDVHILSNHVLCCFVFTNNLLQINYMPCNCNESGKLDFSGVHILFNHVLCCLVFTNDLLQIK